MSSGEDESSRNVKYQYPADFVPFSYDLSTSVLSDEHKELWLIKAPARFDPKCFANLKVPLSGFEMVRSSGTMPQAYSVLNSRTAPSDLHLLIADRGNQTTSLSASGFSGVLNISESYVNCSENQGPLAIPAAPAPCIPPGLKQRFQPFGSSVAAHVDKQVAVVSSTSPERTTLDPDVSRERRKKKKKKDKRNEVEANQQDYIKQEQMQTESHQIELPGVSLEEVPTEERRKKKKIKRERKSSEETVDSSFTFKTEPLDPSYPDIDTPVKKKKKKSRNE
ncbi:CD3e molecule, epsilon associated protein [Triplophysa rosa]|uniref:DNA-directed RNA polymerase I subunit RPA34 n=1 Tax=Triplophysa rosa TaxID=992332 RepID=A0A9W7TKD7_TRIRA|nr:CD3e molecule, epsilon associated protein [Triplophysa rosa]KAI7800488.1 putative DNA-directed RNA polymerase I subunit RPA34 [Triplophysa rosa]